jgi:nucleoside recognition membrane protein YjiH
MSEREVIVAIIAFGVGWFVAKGMFTKEFWSPVRYIKNGRNY